jgi:hypothetical protein
VRSEKFWWEKDRRSSAEDITIAKFVGLRGAGPGGSGSGDAIAGPRARMSMISVMLSSTSSDGRSSRLRGLPRRKKRDRQAELASNPPDPLPPGEGLTRPVICRSVRPEPARVA